MTVPAIGPSAAPDAFRFDTSFQPFPDEDPHVTINRLLDRTPDIRIAEAAHGPADNRRYEYLPTYFLRGLTSLHLELTPAR